MSDNSDTPYRGEFTCWNDVREGFDKGWVSGDGGLRWASGAIKSGPQEPPPVEPEEVIYAGYDIDGYEGSALVIYRQGGKVFEVTGGHCSCYGLEGQWEPEEFDYATYLGVIDRRHAWLHDEGFKIAKAKISLLING